LFDIDGVHGVDIDSDKETRIRFGDSAMTHAMVFTGVDFDDKGLPERWRVENSWGEIGTDKGFFTMHDSWFEQYMFEVAVHISYLPEELQDKVKAYHVNGNKPDFMLPAWDPMGALA
jgi:bleomycin hydrolase